MSEYGEKEGEIVSGTVERKERGIVYLDMGRAVGMLSYDEQIPGERFKQGERVRAFVFKVDETPRGIFLKLSRSHPKFLSELFKAEVPEVATGAVEIKSIAREAGARSKVAVWSNDEGIDPVGALVGQRGVRVTTIMSELGGEKIDVIEWSEDPAEFINEALSPAKIIEIDVDEEENKAKVMVSEEQQSLAIGKGGQNVRLAAKLTGWKIDIESIDGDDDKEESVEEKKTEDDSKDEEASVNEEKEITEESTNEKESEEKKTEDDSKDEEE
jgi:N utilization substance protein A